jgi:hypothetical protein
MRVVVFLFCFCQSVMLLGQAEPPRLSGQGGFYSSKLLISMEAQPGFSIYYTTDGSTPSTKTSQYAVPISIEKTTALRTVAVRGGELSAENIQTYFVNEPRNLTVVSIVTDPANLFSNETGIYITGTNGIRGLCDPPRRNLNQDWERPANVELYEKDGSQAINQGAGIKIFGNCSRTRFPQKSFSVFARKIYGKGKFAYKLFADRPETKYESFVLRSSSDDQVRTMFKDAFAAYSARDRMDLDFMAYRPAALYINGAYWGIHNIREKVNEHYLHSNYGVDEATVNLLENNASVVEGSNKNYNSMLGLLSGTDLASDANYQIVNNLMDVGQYIDYQMLSIHLAEVDWPGNNIKYWQAPNSQYEKWRWILYDRDQTYMKDRINTNAFGLATSGSSNAWPNPSWSTLLLRRLLTNQTFVARFMQSYAYHVSTTYDSTRISQILDTFKAGIAAEIPRHISKWGGKVDPDKTETWPAPTFNSVAVWNANVEDVRSFIIRRNNVAVSHLGAYVNTTLRSSISISANMKNAGKLRFFDKELPENTTASFFNNFGIKLTAIANDGYRFVRWQIGNTSNTNAEIEIKPNGNLDVVAVFEAINTPNLPVVISEINYNSAENANSGDWLELHNPNKFPIDISGWQLTDGNTDNSFVFKPNTILPASGYLVVAENTGLFDVVFPNISNRTGGLGFKLANEGETLALYNHKNILIDTVPYSPKSPWPNTANAGGNSLELRQITADNTLPQSWYASEKKGTPGKPFEALLPTEPAHNEGFVLKMPSPSPTKVSTQIQYMLKQNGHVIIKIYDALGQEKLTVENGHKTAGIHIKTLHTQAFTAGTYHVLMLYNGQYLQVQKLLIL